MNGLFISYAFENLPMFLMLVALMAFSICLHEYCHALVAKLSGDTTAADNGYLTMNPLRVMGINSMLMLLFFGIAWGAVPVRRGNLRTKWRRIWVDIAGITANLALGVVFSLMFLVVALYFEEMESLLMVWQIVAVLNFTMALFNLLPVPPLDGYNVVCELVPKFRDFGSTEFQRGASLLIFLLLFMFGFKILFSIGEVLFMLIIKFGLMVVS